MAERGNEANKQNAQGPSKGISRRQFITGTTSGAISVGVFGNAVAQILTEFASNIGDAPGRQQEQNKRMPAKKKSATP